MEWWSSSSNALLFCLLRNSIVSNRRSREKLDDDGDGSMVEMAVFVEGTASSLGRDTFWVRGSFGNADRRIAFFFGI